ncbi:ATP-binding protein [Arthrobacter bambusae]|uniref:ATP-binding protein n=1 Tax=Arthrobacter bambusae TaxID=1338426 RepID=UPI00278182DB|nr:ATP-binding protein [Arthrobacter bambusae]MDQ0029974.1 two-component system sensor histidine kinase KdpD [Arthrobacter bambusae]MDQ0097508.1 two-component system sensor histidine kinase KdpD [Arthrobacter bambusae]
MARATLRIFLGAAPGVGKTYAMLAEAHRLRGRGEDVVVAFAMDHGRSDTRALMDGLEVIPPRSIAYRDTAFEEMDIDAVLARRPHTAVVDEYAHSNIPGSRNPKRWQDVEELLDAGINVLSTVNVQHLASLGDVVSAITDVRQAETVPDDVVRRADQIHLVDISPELLRQRLGDGKIYAADKIDAALSNYFRMGNLTALRELALLWLADRVDEGLAKYRSEQGIDASWPARERIVIGLTGGPEGEVLVRRAARILKRVNGGDLLAVHVRAADGVASESPQALEAQRLLVRDLGGSYHTVAGEDPAKALLDFARSVNATQIVVGISRRRSLVARLTGRGIGNRVVRDSGDIDVHMVSHPLGGRGVDRPRQRDLGRSRVIVGFAMAVVVPVILQLLLAASPSHSIATAVLVQLTGSVAVALVGGLWPALLGALWSSLLVNFFSIPPVGTLTISDPENILALLVFVGVSAAVAAVVDVSARRSKEAARARAEATTLGDLTRGASSAEDTVEGLLKQALDVFQMRGAALFKAAGAVSTGGPTDRWRLVAKAGEVADLSPEGGENTEQIDAGTRLVLSGRILPASDRRLLSAFGAHLSAQLERRQLAASRREIARLAESNTMRTSILRAVSHDLRTPLAGIKLAVGGLRQSDVHYTPEEEQELLATIEECSDRLDVLVGNLLDMSRITSDSVNALIRPVRWYEVIPAALHGVPPGRVRVDLPGNMPEIDADAGMLERVIANIVENAIKYAPDSDVVLVGAAGGFSSSTLDGRPSGELRIIDHGQGVPAESVVRMFQPFQRLNDVPSTTGVGLGLAVAKGFTEAMGGTLTAEETPGGGLTMVIRLPLSTGVAFPYGAPQAPMEAQSVLLERRHTPPSGIPDSASKEAG